MPVSGRNDIDVGQYWLVYIETSLFWVELLCRSMVQKSPLLADLCKFGGGRGAAKRIPLGLDQILLVKEKPPVSSSPPTVKAWWLACQNLQDFVVAKQGWEGYELRRRLVRISWDSFLLRNLAPLQKQKILSSDFAWVQLRLLLRDLSRLRSELPPCQLLLLPQTDFFFFWWESLSALELWDRF